MIHGQFLGGEALLAIAAFAFTNAVFPPCRLFQNFRFAPFHLHGLGIGRKKIMVHGKNHLASDGA